MRSAHEPDTARAPGEGGRRRELHARTICGSVILAEAASAGVRCWTTTLMLMPGQERDGWPVSAHNPSMNTDPTVRNKPTASSKDSDPSSPQPAGNFCLGGCGKVVPPGQKCIPCATAAVDVWVAARRGDQPAE